MREEAYKRLKDLAESVSSADVGYPLHEAKAVILELKQSGWSKEETWTLCRQLWKEFEGTAAPQEFVEDLLDILSGYYVGMNIQW